MCLFSGIDLGIFCFFLPNNLPFLNVGARAKNVGVAYSSCHSFSLHLAIHFFGLFLKGFSGARAKNVGVAIN